MYCTCGAPMVRQPLGHWRRLCDCTGRQYWWREPPTPGDRRAFHQLTGRPVVEGVNGWRYGRKS